MRFDSNEVASLKVPQVSPDKHQPHLELIEREWPIHHGSNVLLGGTTDVFKETRNGIDFPSAIGAQGVDPSLYRHKPYQVADPDFLTGLYFCLLHVSHSVRIHPPVRLWPLFPQFSQVR